MSTDIRTTFDTPTPIDVSFALQGARLDLLATDRADTVVTIAPRNPNRAGDVNASQQTTAELVDGTLTIVQPKEWKIKGPSNSIVVTVELPSDSIINGTIAYGNVRGRGRVGTTHVKSSYGDIAFEELGSAELHTSYGDVTVLEARGDAQLTTAYGAVRADVIEGAATVKTSYGEITIGEVAGALTANVSTGGIRVDYAGSETFAKIAYGSIRIGEVEQGSVRLEGSGGDLEVGVPEGTAAWLDLNSAKGYVRNELTADAAPQPGDKTVEIRARVTWGDIVIHRPVNRRPGERRTSKKGNN
jgi:DUF4097 and DUF4098 domain-containing protein YvlB